MLTVRYEMDLSDFDAWSGAVSTLDTLIEHGLTEAMEDVLNDRYPEGIDETHLNDILRFERDWIWECLGVELDEDGEPIFED